MRLWDSSALIPLIIIEPQSPAMREMYVEDPDVLVWWSTGVELVSAVARRRRSAPADVPNVTEALVRLDRIIERAEEVAPSTATRETARRLLLAHPLRAADSLQLAAAVVLRDNRAEPFDFVTLDTRLGQAAAAEGFRVIPV